MLGGEPSEDTAPAATKSGLDSTTTDRALSHGTKLLFQEEWWAYATCHHLTRYCKHNRRWFLELYKQHREFCWSVSWSDIRKSTRGTNTVEIRYVWREICTLRERPFFFSTNAEDSL